MLKPKRHTRLLLTTLNLVLLSLPPLADAQKNSLGTNQVPKPILVGILKAEDERRWDKELEILLTDLHAPIRKRALLAAGRIGDERAVAIVSGRLQKETEPSVRAMAAFALGEIESPAATEVLISHLGSDESAIVRARAVEALGKIGAAMPKTEESRANVVKKEILGVLEFEAGRRSAPDEAVILLALTAALRARPEGAGKVVAKFLDYSDARIRADAANALARLRAKDGNEQLRKLLISDPDPVVRANAARVLGVTEDKESAQAIMDRVEKDEDERVRVSAVRAFVSLKPESKGLLDRFLEHAHCQRTVRQKKGLLFHERDDYECLEIITALGRLFQGTEDSKALNMIEWWLQDFPGSQPEIEIARVRLSPLQYLNQLGDETKAKRTAQERMLTDWHAASALAQGLGQIAALPDSVKNRSELKKRAEDILRAMLDYRNSGLTINTLVAVHSEYAIPDVLRALSAFKPADLPAILRPQLKESDAIVRATAAELLGELSPDKENSNALISALPVALKDSLNDAALAIVDALAKQKSSPENEAIKSALKSEDYLIRRRAVAALKSNGVGDLSDQARPIQIRNQPGDYERALSRMDKRVIATVETDKGNFVIQLLPEDAPLTVDNFVQLARRGYFNRVTFHRVVPNFVIQGGDPRGDGNGGPGYSIRCEINMVPYDRGAVGMALSGKDTGGSQWFVTHSPQPHLDGGYTVFGNVIQGMDVVDAIKRGDSIISIAVSESRLTRERARQ